MKKLINSISAVLLILLNIVVWTPIFTACNNLTNVDKVVNKKIDTTTLAGKISDNIIKHPTDWKDSTDSETYSNALLWIQSSERWVNTKCNIKIEFRIHESPYRETEGYLGYIDVISNGDTANIQGEDLQILAPILDSILIKGAIEVQEMKEKMRLDSIQRVEKIKENRILKNFCK